MKTPSVFLGLLAFLSYTAADDVKPGDRLPVGSEVVMSPGMRITATTSVGTIAATAVDELTRSYTWDGATGAVKMTPRATTTGRVCGSLGIFNDVDEPQWRATNGITRALMEEGQQDFTTVEEAMRWIKKRPFTPCVYRDDGLVVGWSKDITRGRLFVEVWQALINGQKPKRLPGSENDKIVVETVKTEAAPLGKAAASADLKPRSAILPAGSEVVMSSGMRITATTTVGRIAITAVDALTRAYTWDGATRAVEMEPRAATTGRWHGSLGLLNPGAGEHWRDHHGITRSVTEEGQQHFKTVEEAMNWIKQRGWMPFVYRDDGLMVGWSKNLDRMQLSVEVWQILIDGKKPTRLTGSQSDKIVVETVETETVPLVRAVASNDLKAVTAQFGPRGRPECKEQYRDSRPAHGDQE